MSRSRAVPPQTPRHNLRLTILPPFAVVPRPPVSELRGMRIAAISMATVLTISLLTASASAEPAKQEWTGAWGESAQEPFAPFGPNWSTAGFANQTVRQVIRVDAGGPALRIRLSN